MLRPIVLIILDGWGIAPPGPGNAISQARTPNMDRLTAGFPHTELRASGEAVGLPHGEDGNTETGHLNIGAGQVVFQDLPRINMSIADGSFFENTAFVNVIDHLKKTSGQLHLLGLVGSGGVHSNIEHLFALIRLAKQRGIGQVFIHVITDGRDSPPTSALTYISQLKQHIASIGIGKIASVMGRYFAMDRDHRWERTEKAYVALTNGSPMTALTPEQAIKDAYERQETDEFILPTTLTDADRRPVALIRDGDGVIFFNFRIDRPRQLTKAFVLPNFENQAKEEEFDPFSVKYFKSHLAKRRLESAPFHRGPKLQNLYFATMTRYEIGLPVDVAFPPQFIPMPVGRVLSDRSLRQLRVAETEKERFVTYYFNGQREEPFPGEDRIIVPSPAVATYDLKPEMSTPELQKAVLSKLDTGTYDFIVVNVACPDMVAHTGNLRATITACEAADSFVGAVSDKTLSLNGGCVITADHGNAEELTSSETGGPDTEHSTFSVPIIIASRKLLGKSGQLPSGVLADVTPTILSLMDIEKPSSMTGKSLI